LGIGACLHTCGTGDYLGGNERQDAIIASKHGKRWQLCGNWQNRYLMKIRRIWTSKNESLAFSKPIHV
jgi:hypothetical protein